MRTGRVDVHDAPTDAVSRPWTGCGVPGCPLGRLIRRRHSPRPRWSESFAGRRGESCGERGGCGSSLLDTLDKSEHGTSPTLDQYVIEH